MTSLAAFTAADVQRPASQISDGEVTKLTGADACIEEGEDDGEVALVVAPMLKDGANETGCFFLSVGYDGFLVWFWGCDAADDVFFGVVFVDAPAPETTKTGVIVFDGLFVDGEIGEEGAYVAMGDLVHIRVFREIDLKA